MSRPTPGVLRESAVSALVGAMHNSHAGGPWSLVEVVSGYDSHEHITRLTFAIGYPPESGDDTRPRVEIRVVEK